MSYIVQTGLTHPQHLEIGKFQTLEELDSYERMWHNLIFKQCHSNIHQDVSSLSFDSKSRSSTCYMKYFLNSLENTANCGKTPYSKILGMHSQV